MSQLLDKRVEPVKDRNHKDRNGNGRGQKDRSVLIFGGAGFIGSNLAHYLLTRTSACVHVFDSLVRNGVQHNLEWLKEVAANSNRLRITIADVRDRVLVERAVARHTDIPWVRLYIARWLRAPVQRPDGTLEQR